MPVLIFGTTSQVLFMRFRLSDFDRGYHSEIYFLLIRTLSSFSTPPSLCSQGSSMNACNASALDCALSVCSGSGIEARLRKIKTKSIIRREVNNKNGSKHTNAKNKPER